MRKLLTVLYLVNLFYVLVIADQHRMPVDLEELTERDERFKVDYEILNEKLTNLLDAAKYEQLNWKEIEGMKMLMDNNRPITFKVPGKDTVAYITVLDQKDENSNSNCTVGNIMASQQFWNSANSDNDVSLNYWHDSYPNLNPNYIPAKDDDDGNDTPLCCSAKNNNTYMALEIANWGGSPLPVCRYGFTALCYSAQNGNANMTQNLIKEGSVVNVDCKGKNDDSGTPLCQSSKINSTSTSKVLLSANATVNSVCSHSSPLCWTTFYNNEELSLDYIYLGANVNFNCEAFDTSVWPQITGYPICYGVFFDNIDITTALLEAKADPNVMCKDYRFFKTQTWTPICYAENYNENDMVDLLLSYGATPCNYWL
eukprot:TRINITY_DN16600_c0_g1_i1.p1 TRINITY_DN16600_c0_g1~~TRINITY_DN16600_c0_g1_i1.p1  ORF type:complete len:370 (-),score=56.71 TRINITY_DN16600_c0_g1_i1:110-1219(-)